MTSISNSLQKLAKKRVFSDEEFRDADQMNKILIHLINPHKFILTDTDECKLEQLQKCYGILCTNLNESATMAKLKKEFPQYKPSRIREIIKETETFYGNQTEQNKALERKKFEEMLKRLIEKSVEAGEYNAASRFTKQLAELKEFNKAEAPISPHSFPVPTFVRMSSNASLLKLDKAEDAQIDD